MEKKYLKSQGVALFADKVDVEKGILYDVVMCQEGPAKGHGVELERSFIEELVAYDVKHFSKQGVKSRFGHPAMCGGDPMGTQAGSFFNFRTREVEMSQGQGKRKIKVMQAIADLHLLDASNDSPTHPGMKDYLLKMAQENPDFIMQSIVFRPGAEYQYDAKGEKVVLESDEFGYINLDKTQSIFVEFKEHYYTDIVEAGAATDSLFSAQFNQKSFAVQAVEWLNDNPSIKEFIKSNPDKVKEFLDTCGIIIPNTSQNFSTTMEFLKKIFGTEDPKAIQEKLELANTELSKQHEALTQKDKEFAELKAAKEETQAAFDKAKKAHETALAEATATIGILSKESKGSHSAGKSEFDAGDGGEDKMPLWKKFAAEHQ